jgi:hypothetical protein
VLGKLGASIPAIKKELECYIGPARARRRGKKAARHCSFCGRDAGSGIRMVAGPNVWICAECVSLASEVLADDDGRTGQG